MTLRIHSFGNSHTTPAGPVAITKVTSISSLLAEPSIYRASAPLRRVSGHTEEKRIVCPKTPEPRPNEIAEKDVEKVTKKEQVLSFGLGFLMQFY